MSRTQHQKTHKVPARWYKDDPLARSWLRSRWP
jgi:hypothetical protein